MRKPFLRRVQGVVGWGLLACGIAMSGAMAASARWWFGYSAEAWLVDLGDGALYMRRVEASPWSRPVLGWSAGDNGRDTGTWSWTWWTWGEQNLAWDRGLYAYTVWPAGPALLLAGAGLMWPGRRAARRARANQCVGCAYSRAGLGAESPCPECGCPLDAAAGPAARTSSRP